MAMWRLHLLCKHEDGYSDPTAQAKLDMLGASAVPACLQHSGCRDRRISGILQIRELDIFSRT